ncbi:MAG TPA: dienelactone hydrolase family protein [Anaerolineales bacterium]|nr:dienelactone hydrolase family protein [Anaerolineales bacterium]
MNDFQQYLAGEFVEDYEEGRLTRREALKLIASVTGSLVLAQTMLAACAPPPTESPTSTTAPASPTKPAATSTAQPAATEPSATATTAPASPTAVVSGTVSPDDPAVTAGPVEILSDVDGATLTGYLARPNTEGAFPVVLVCHENRGLTDHIKDVARRLGKAGYVALAMDLLSRQGGTEAVGSSGVPGALGNTPPDQFVQDFVSGWHYLQTQSFAQADRVGMTGFCFGGGVTWRVATQMPELKAAVPFYGPHPSTTDVPNINAKVLAIYGELDSRINQGIPAIEAAMQANNKVYEKVIYPNADHAFHNDTGSRYNPEAAQDAWARALAWFGKYLTTS